MKILLQESIEFYIRLRQSETRYKQNTEKFLVTRSVTSWKIDPCFGLYEREEKRDKSEFATKFVGVIVGIIFI